MLAMNKFMSSKQDIVNNFLLMFSSQILCAVFYPYSLDNKTAGSSRKPR